MNETMKERCPVCRSEVEVPVDGLTECACHAKLRSLVPFWKVTESGYILAVVVPEGQRVEVHYYRKG